MALILVVEDDEHQRELYTESLEEDGHEIVSARDGREALAAVEQQKPDLVVMDISMPGMDGIEAMNRMLARDNRIPIILNTAYGTYEEDFRSWSADAYVVKTSDMTELKSTIEAVLEERGIH